MRAVSIPRGAFARAPLALLALTTLAGATARLLFIGARALRLDEAVSWGIVRMPWPTFVNIVATAEANMIAYYVPLRAWLRLGEGEATIRGLSVVFGVLAIPAIYRLGAFLFGRREGLIAAALLAVHPFHVHFSQDARSYSLVALLVIVSSELFARALRAPSGARVWTAYAFVAALSVYAHVFALLVLVAHAIAFLVHRRVCGSTGVPRRAVALLALGIAPMAAFLVAQNKGRLAWVPHPTPEHLTRVLNDLAGSDAAGAAILAFAAFASAVLLRAPNARSSRGAEAVDARSATALLALWFTVPFVLAAAFSLARPVLVSRYLLMCVPALVVILARGITVLSERVRFGRVVAVVAAALVLSVLAVQFRADVRHRLADRNEWAPTARHILAAGRDGDAALVYFWSNRYLLEYYAQRESARTGAAFTPRFIYPYADGVAPPSRRADVTPAEWNRISRGFHRIWLVAPGKFVRAGALHAASEDAKLALIRAQLDEEFALQESATFEGGFAPLVVELYVREGIATAR